MKVLYHIFDCFKFCRRKIGGSWYKILKWDDLWESYVSYWVHGERPKEYEIFYDGGGSTGQTIEREEHYSMEKISGTK